MMNFINTTIMNKAAILFVMTLSWATVFGQNENEEKKESDKFLSIGLNYGFAHSQIGGDIRHRAGAFGISRGFQINAGLFPLLKGDLSTNIGVRSIARPEITFYDDRFGELNQYRFGATNIIYRLHFSWSPKGEVVPYFEVGAYYSDSGDEGRGAVNEVSSGDIVEMSNVDGYGQSLGAGLKYRKKGSRFQSTFGFEKYSDYHRSNSNNMFGMSFTTFNVRVSASYFLF